MASDIRPLLQGRTITFTLSQPMKSSILLLANDNAKLEIDSHVVAVMPPPKAQVCGAIEHLVPLTSASLGLKVASEFRPLTLWVLTALHRSGKGLVYRFPTSLLQPVPLSAAA